MLSRSPRFLFAFFLLLVLASISTAQAPPRQRRPEHVRGRVLVGFRPEVSVEQAHEALAAQQGRCAGEIGSTGVHIVELPAGAVEEAYIHAFQQRPEVAFAELDGIVQPQGITPSDTYFPNQWALTKIFAPDAWLTTTGSNTVPIAIIDTGVNPVPDLAGNTTDMGGHGTSVAGVAAATTNNAAGIAAPCWECVIMPVRASDTNGNGYVSLVANGITWAADHGAKVAVVGYPFTYSSSVTSAAQYFQSKGGVVVIPAGNTGTADPTPDSPYALTVSATDFNDALYSWSAVGNFVDVAAPGGAYGTTYVGTYAFMTGTSYSAALVGGVAGLVVSAKPCLSGDQISTVITQSADDLGVAGRDTSFGWGRLNALRAVLLAGSTACSAGTPPVAPSNLSVSAASASQINLTWADNSTNESGFKIERCQGSGCTAFVQIATVGAGVTSYSDGSLASSTTYTYRVRAWNASGDSAYSNTAQATTQSVPPPNAPSNLIASAVSASQINLSWADNSTNESGFKIERCQGAGCTSFVQIATVAAGVTGYGDPSLASSTTYTYRVRAWNASGDSAYSNTAQATTQPAPPPNAPSNLLASAVSASQINLSWTDNSSDESGFKIERCQGAGCTSFVQIATVAAGVTGYGDPSLASSTTYTYRVRAWNASGDSAYSNTAQATTQPAPPPNAPSNLLASAVSASQINLSWADNSTNESGFKIERCQGAGCTSFVQIATVGAGVTGYGDPSLASSTTYTYRVRAWNASGDSAYSNAAQATTTSAASGSAPAAPSNLAGSAGRTGNRGWVSLSWIDNSTNETNFDIERCSGAGCTSFAPVTSVGANVTSYRDSPLGRKSTYQYRIKARNSVGSSGYSNIIQVTTP